MSAKIIPRWSTERGNADHGWLKTFHTFSFAMYQDGEHDSFGSLRVINEDRVEASTGFGTHGHREFEIFSYIINGELEHRDSMGNKEVLKRGDVQLTSAGTGIRHSEVAHGPNQVHFAQIWTVPWKSGLSPKYFTRHFSDDEKKDKWVQVVAPVGAKDVSSDREGSGPAPVQSPVTLSATLLSPSTTLTHILPSPTTTEGKSSSQRKAYIHIIQSSGYNPSTASGASVKISGPGAELVLREGDGAYVLGTEGSELKFENTGNSVAEILLFDVE
ncbi:pirin domain-containing protein [Schizopora paradoxa]|uniref:Pirin domain-containing protein n=1 Tax=Schizopora paradoxa TaxID=27342 RepID=A0A0H2SBN1_9AGAM|nr:pirin domain-containing protein [Schizopora paradoxa]